MGGIKIKNLIFFLFCLASVKVSARECLVVFDSKAFDRRPPVADLLKYVENRPDCNFTFVPGLNVSSTMSHEDLIKFLKSDAFSSRKGITGSLDQDLIGKTVAGKVGQFDEGIVLAHGLPGAIEMSNSSDKALMQLAKNEHDPEAMDLMTKKCLDSSEATKIFGTSSGGSQSGECPNGASLNRCQKEAMAFLQIYKPIAGKWSLDAGPEMLKIPRYKNIYDGFKKTEATLEKEEQQFESGDKGVRGDLCQTVSQYQTAEDRLESFHFGENAPNAESKQKECQTGLKAVSVKSDLAKCFLAQAAGSRSNQDLAKTQFTQLMKPGAELLIVSCNFGNDGSPTNQNYAKSLKELKNCPRERAEFARKNGTDATASVTEGLHDICSNAPEGMHFTAAREMTEVSQNDDLHESRQSSGKIKDSTDNKNKEAQSSPIGTLRDRAMLECISEVLASMRHSDPSGSQVDRVQEVLSKTGQPYSLLELERFYCEVGKVDHLTRNERDRIGVTLLNYNLKDIFYFDQLRASREPVLASPRDPSSLWNYQMATYGPGKIGENQGRMLLRLAILKAQEKAKLGAYFDCYTCSGQSAQKDPPGTCSMYTPRWRSIASFSDTNF